MSAPPPEALAAAALAIAADLIPMVPQKRGDGARLPPEVTQKLAARTQRVAAAAAAAPKLAPPAHGALSIAVDAKPVAAPMAADHSIALKVRVVGVAIRVQLSATKETIQAHRAGKVPPAATLALQRALPLAPPGVLVQIMGGPKVLASATAPGG